ncbi:MAG: HAD-IA family hydrolase [Methylophilus sp.]
MINTVLFDLDGTLVDTAPDLGYALNIQLERHGKPVLADEVIRPYASHGTRGLLEIGFQLSPDDADFIGMRDEYLAIYDQVFTRSPRLFDGMDLLLNTLESKGLAWGIVTNKPGRFTRPLVESMGLNLRAAAVISGDDAALPKPSPATLLLACDKIGVKPENCLYIGDAARDIEAGRAAGMKTVVALFGYIDSRDQPEQWLADYMIKQPEQILTLLNLS